MKVLVINAGSSSIKYQLIDMTDESLLAKGQCDRIGIDGGNFKQRIGFSVKSSCFNIDHNRIKTTKTVAQTGKLSVIGHQGLLQGGKSSAHYGKF